MRYKGTFIMLMIVILITGCTSKTNSQQVETDTVIVGGGLSGLTSAFLLNKEGKDFIVLEKEEVVGGKAVGGEKDGFYYAKGTEYIGEPTGVLDEMINTLGIKLLEIPSPMDIHYAQGEKYYGEIGLMLHLVDESSIDEFNTFVDKVLAVYQEYEELPYFDPTSQLARLDQISAAEWFAENNFSQVYYDTYNVTSKGLFGATLEEVSTLNMIPEIAFDFIDSMQLTERHVENFRNLNKPFKSRQGSQAYSFKKGMSEIPLALYNDMKPNIRLSSWVKDISKSGNQYVVTYIDLTNNESKTLRCNNVIMAVPSPLVLSIAGELLSTEQYETLKQIPYASYITTALYTDSYVVNEAFDMAVPDGYFFTDIYDSTWIQREYDDNVKDKTQSILSLYIAPTSYKSNALSTMDDETVLKNIYRDLKKVKGYEGLEEHITGHDIYRIEYAYPIMVPGAYSRLQKLHDGLNGSFQLAGDYMIYPTLEGAVESGSIAARKILRKQ